MMTMLGAERKIQKWINEMKADDGAGWDKIQTIWSLDFVFSILIGVLFSLQHLKFQKLWLDILICIFLLVGYLLLWRFRDKQYQQSYIWWKPWCKMAMVPYGIIMFGFTVLIMLLIF